MILCLAFTFLAFIIATNYISIKWSILPAAIVFILMSLALYFEAYVFAIIIAAILILAMLVTVIKINRK